MKAILLFLGILCHAVLLNAQSHYITSFKTDTYGGPSPTVKAGNKLFFSAFDTTHGRELWCTDGTTAGTHMVADINPGINNGIANYFELTVGVMNGILYFRGDNGVNGVELWRSDGTQAGTYMVEDIAPGSASSGPGYLTPVNSKLFFTANTGTQLWCTDGTTAGTQVLASFQVASSLYGYNNKLYFSADVNNSGQELWRSDGTPAGTVLMNDLNGAFGASLPCNFHATGNALYFTAVTATGWELWKTTGTAASTTLVKDINPGGANGVIDFYSDAYMTHIGNTLYFRAQDGVHGYQLWESDGTDAGTVMVTNLTNGVDAYCTLPVVNGTVLVNNYAVNHFWVYDPVADSSWETYYPSRYYFNTNSASRFTFIDDKMFYTRKDTIYGCEIGVADGTQRGDTVLQETHLTDNWFAYPSQGFNSIFGTLNDTLLFTMARNPTNFEIPLFAYNATTTDTCFAPSVIVPVKIADTSAHFVWNRTGNTGQYEFRYREVGTVAWDTVATATSFCLLNNLLPATDYEYEIRSACNGAWTGWSETAVYSTGFVQDDYLVHILAERSENLTTERLYWLKTPQITKLQFRYRPFGTTSWVFTTSTNGYKRITGLVPYTFYEYQYRLSYDTAWDDWNTSIRYFVTDTVNVLPPPPPPTGISETQAVQQQLLVYPNPAKGLIHISGIQPEGQEVTLSDNMGRVVKTAKLLDASIDISALPRGIYILKIISPDHTIVKKLLKE